MFCPKAYILYYCTLHIDVYFCLFKTLETPNEQSFQVIDIMFNYVVRLYD